MSGIKYYQLKEDEELPDEFCAVKDVNGEPSEYTFYRPETENTKLRKLVESYGMIANEAVCDYYDRDEMLADANATASELGIEVGV